MELDFIYAGKLVHCLFTKPCGKETHFSQPPILVKGLGGPMVFFHQCAREQDNDRQRIPILTDQNKLVKNKY